MKFAFSNARSLEEAEIVVFGVPTESGLGPHGRRGTAQAPEAIRKASQEMKWLAPAELPKIYDAGDLPKNRVAAFVEKLVREGRKPVCLGGDHSITFEVLRGISAVRPVSFVYFDAHPDLICSRGHYHGSVICDAAGLRQINLKKSLEIGLRAEEPEELEQIRRRRLRTLTMNDVVETGVRKIPHVVERIVGKDFYMSIDMDVLDPAFAPGVSTPSPGGMASADLIWLIKELSSSAIGLDVMEMNPKFDTAGHTAELAVRLVLEFCGPKG